MSIDEHQAEASIVFSRSFQFVGSPHHEMFGSRYSRSVESKKQRGRWPAALRPGRAEHDAQGSLGCQPT